jgi:hypothetical protein
VVHRQRIGQAEAELADGTDNLARETGDFTVQVYLGHGKLHPGREQETKKPTPCDLKTHGVGT